MAKDIKDVGKWIPTLPEKMLMGIIPLLEDNLVTFMKSPLGREREVDEGLYTLKINCQAKE